jgi:RNA-binding protein 25
MSSTPTPTTISIEQLRAQHRAQQKEEDLWRAKEDKLFEEELAQQAEEERKRLEEEKWWLEVEERTKLEEAEKAYKAQLQQEKHWREKEKRKVMEIKEDDKDMEKEPSGSNKKVSDWILKENY